MGEENKSLGNISKRVIKDPSVPFFGSASVGNVRARGDNYWVDSCWQTSGNTAQEVTGGGTTAARSLNPLGLGRSWGPGRPRPHSPARGHLKVATQVFL